jgi:hypothetical protein
MPGKDAEYTTAFIEEAFAQCRLRTNTVESLSSDSAAVSLHVSLSKHSTLSQLTQLPPPLLSLQGVGVLLSRKFGRQMDIVRGDLYNLTASFNTAAKTTFPVSKKSEKATKQRNMDHAK